MRQGRRDRVFFWAFLLTVTGAAAASAIAGCGKDTPAGGSGAKPVAAKPAPTGSGVITGVIKFNGAAPPPEPWGGTSSSDCKALHGDTIQLVKVADGKLQDAFVYVKAGLPEGSYDTPEKAVSMDQKACEFEPRVLGVMAEQPIEFLNSDIFMHNVKSPEFNQGLATRGVKMKLKLANEGVMVPIRCDVHPWMRAFVGVMSHPYFDVSKADGAFRLAGLVDGEYTVAAWHEKLGTLEQKVKVAGGAPATVDFEFQAK
jgi:plastocyanin